MSHAALLHRDALIPLDNLLGAWLIGVIVSAVLFGVTCLQVHLYFTKHCARDTIFLQVFVALLLSLDTLHLALASCSFYSVTVSNFGDYVQLAKPSWSFFVRILHHAQNISYRRYQSHMKIQIVIGLLLSIQVQLFYAFRIYLISGKRLVMPIIITISALAELGLGIVFTVRAFQANAFKNGANDTPYTLSALALDVLCFFLITAAMIYHLMKNKSDSLHKTNRGINLLIAYFVSSGALMMVFAICTLVARIISATTLWYIPFLWVDVRICGLSFMTILNSRKHVRERMFASHAMVTLPSGGFNGTPIHATLDENIVFDTSSKNARDV
ncbi:hypothetical protein C8R47DRAFT_1320544 [Mycena vitilis]|nr:hypothetical protein C8R47DRAFT_1320544 [Mycena vitilis]